MDGDSDYFADIGDLYFSLVLCCAVFTPPRRSAVIVRVNGFCLPCLGSTSPPQRLFMIRIRTGIRTCRVRVQALARVSCRTVHHSAEKESSVLRSAEFGGKSFEKTRCRATVYTTPLHNPTMPWSHFLSLSFFCIVLMIEARKCLIYMQYSIV